jgi:hypothetical protein
VEASSLASSEAFEVLELVEEEEVEGEEFDEREFSRSQDCKFSCDSKLESIPALDNPLLTSLLPSLSPISLPISISDPSPSSFSVEVGAEVEVGGKLLSREPEMD